MFPAGYRHREHRTDLAALKENIFLRKWRILEFSVIDRVVAIEN